MKNPFLWRSSDSLPAFTAAELAAEIQQIRTPLHVVVDASTGRRGVATGGELVAGKPDGALEVIASLPASFPEWLGDRGFCEAHAVRFPYVAGEMATGIASAAMVIAMGKADMLGFFGAAGLPLAEIEKAIDEIEAALGPAGKSWGANLIHSPQEKEMEAATVDLFLRRKVRRVSASAFMELTPSVVRYAASGLRLDEHGRVARENHVFAKVSRPEVARQFLSPASAGMLRGLVEQGAITAQEAELAARVPVAEFVTAEADSGGHTDNRQLSVLLPTLLKLRDQLAAEHRYERTPCIGAAGGLGTPSAVAAAFALGAGYVMTGSVNQSAIEAGTSPEVKKMLAQADLADVAMAPAADMFSLGVKVQVLKRGTLFAGRAARLYQIWRDHGSLEEIPAADRAQLEKDLFRAPLAEVWASTRQYWSRRDPREVEKADRDGKHRMALVFRWYLGTASRWARSGDQSRRLDFQIWCGPAMGAFNAWVKGSFLADPENRTVAQIAKNLLEGAAVVARAQQLRALGVPVPASAFTFEPRLLS